MVRQKYLQRIRHDTIFTISHDIIPYQIMIFFSIDDSKREVLRNRGCSKKRKQENKNPPLPGILFMRRKRSDCLAPLMNGLRSYKRSCRTP